MDLSGLIFVALAVAWAAYLIPKALRHHDDVVRGRSIDRFSHSMRVLARREPVSARMARLVVTPAKPTTASAVTAPPAASPEEQDAVRRASTHRATQRRRRVLGLLLLTLAGAVVTAALGRLGWTYAVIPGGLLVAWLVACRLMVRRERAWQPSTFSDVEDDAVDEVQESDTPQPPVDTSTPPRDPKLWDPVPVTLPTYVSKPPARRTVRTIDLDATGVWTSGRTEADSALAREADAAEAADRVRRRVSRKDDSGEEAVGS